MCKGSWFEDSCLSLVLVNHCYFPLGVFGYPDFGCPQMGVWLLGISLLALVFILSLSLIVVWLMSGIGCVQLFESMNLLKKGGLNKIYSFLLLSMWWGNRLGRTREGVVWATLGRSILIMLSGGASTIASII